MDWKECIDGRFARETKFNEYLIRSLILSSKNKFKSSERLELDETTVVSKISLCYDSLREVLEAFAIKKGFKVYNHECFCSFLKEICSEKNFANEFDRFRLIRNNLNYYGKKISLKEGSEIIRGITDLREKILDKYFGDFVE